VCSTRVTSEFLKDCQKKKEPSNFHEFWNEELHYEKKRIIDSTNYEQEKFIINMKNVGLYIHCYCLSANNPYLSMPSLSKFSKLRIIN
jgi:hypothetical protein